MRNLRYYTREELLALPAGEELDGLVCSLIGIDTDYCQPGYGPSQNSAFVGIVLEKLREYWPQANVGTGKMRWMIGKGQYTLSVDCAKSESLPHVCALALVLAAWEKAKREENKE